MDEQPKIDRYQGWDQEKGEYFERVHCPVCGYSATIYDSGLEVVEKQRNPSCSCCRDEVEKGSPVVDGDYGTSWGDNSNYDDDGGCVGCIFALFLLPIVIVLFVVNVLGIHP